ncbi:MAG: histidine kinase [Leptospiraceae bacterium]|nr:histidine kinase [Leptospiraceae bacterium]MCP5511667.1 histidine kinase [Leptospiraceae bacterium]
MSLVVEEIDANIEIKKDNLSFIEIKTYRISQKLEEMIHGYLEMIFKDSSRPHIIPLVYTIIKELGINACKANQKRVFFEEKGYDITDHNDYTKGIIEYKASFSESMGLEYGPKSKQKGYFCNIRFDYSSNGFTVTVTNNTPITKQEEKSIREKLAKAMSYDDLAQFYMDNADNTEGAGLGLALIIIMLKGEGIDPNYFRISINAGNTMARLEIPLNSDFKSIRD